MLGSRLISGTLLFLLVGSVAAFDDRLSGIPLLLLAMLTGGFGAVELTRLVRGDAPVRPWLTVVTVETVILGLWLLVHREGAGILGVLGPGLLAGVAVVYARPRSRWTRPTAWAVLLGTTLIALPLVSLLALQPGHSGWVILGVVLVIKSCDIGAYFTGRQFGRRPLAPKLSPAKTWEGAVGGTVTSMGVAVGLAHLGHGLLHDPDPLPGVPSLLLGGLVLAVAGQVGDLCISALKRTAGAKDASSLIPGIGGMLDVLDSLILAAPAAWWMLEGPGRS